MSQDLRKKLAKNLKEIRKKKKITKGALSIRLGFDDSYISKLEKGNMNITLDKLEAISNYFEIDVIELLK